MTEIGARREICTNIVIPVKTGIFILVITPTSLTLTLYTLKDYTRLILLPHNIMETMSVRFPDLKLQYYSSSLVIREIGRGIINSDRDGRQHRA
jgi:hypothetical protein